MTGMVVENVTKRACCVIIALQIEQGAATVHPRREMIRRHPSAWSYRASASSPTQTR